MAKLTVVTEERLQYYNGKVADTYVEQVSGKQLSTNDYDNAEKQKVAGAVQESQLDGKIEGLGYAKSEDIPTDYLTDSDLNGYAKTSEVADGYVAKEQGKGLSTNDYDATEKAKVDGALQAKDLDGKLAEKNYVTSSQITDFVTGNDVDQKITTATNKIGKVQGSCTKADLATKATTANNQDVWIVTDCDNHLYMFVGTGMPGADANGFMDLGNHIDVDGIVSQAQTGMVKEADLEAITTSTIDSWFA